VPDKRKSKAAVAPADARRPPSRPKRRRVDTAAIYQALHGLNEGFRGVYRAMEALNEAGLRKGDLFEGCRLLAEEAQAWASYLVLEAVAEQELTNWTVTGQHRQEWLQTQADFEKFGEAGPRSRAAANKKSARTAKKRT
jgi:hypothetical protein